MAAAGTTRDRETVRFWLNAEKEKAIIQEIKVLKRDRAFTDGVRKGVSLFYDLTYRQSVDLLLMLFPWIEHIIIRMAIEKGLVRPATDSSDDSSSLQKLSEELAELKQMLANRPHLPSGDSPALPESRPIAKLPAANNINNIDLEIKKTSKPVNVNRIMILQVWLTSSEKNIELFKREDLEMVTGHHAFNQSAIKAEIARRKKEGTWEAGEALVAPAPVEEKTEETPPPYGGGNSKQLKGAEIEFAAPDFEELDLL